MSKELQNACKIVFLLFDMSVLVLIASYSYCCLHMSHMNTFFSANTNNFSSSVDWTIFFLYYIMGMAMPLPCSFLQVNILRFRIYFTSPENLEIQENDRPNIMELLNLPWR